METVALLPLTASDPGLAASATSQAAQGLRDLQVFRVVDPDTISGLLGAEAMRQTTGCSDASCLAELAGAVGAAYVVSGSVASSGGGYTLTLVLTDQRSASSVDGVVRQEKSLQDVGPAARLAAQAVVRKLLGNKLGTLRLVSPEKGADVKIDDVLVGTTPLSPRQLPMGPHKISVEKTGFIAFRQEVVVRANEVAALNAELIPSQEFINAYRTRNRVLRTFAWLGTGLSVGALASGLLSYLGWLGVFVGFNTNTNSSEVMQSLVRPPRSAGDVFIESTSLREKNLWVLLDVLLAGMVVAPLLAAGWAIFSVVFWIIGDDPGRYNRYSE